MLIQYDLFKSKEECEIEALLAEFQKTNEKLDDTNNSVGKMQRKLFAENGKLKHEISELTFRLGILEKFICKYMIYEQK